MKGKKLNAEIRARRDAAYEVLLTEAESLYVDQHYTIQEIVEQFRSSGKSIATWRLCQWLKQRNVIRTNEQTTLTRRKFGVINNQCGIPGCSQPAQGCKKFCLQCIPDGTAHRAWLYYGVTNQTIMSLFEKQKGMCRGCGILLTRGGSTKRGSKRTGALCIDHDHYTNHVRGLLCNNCNRSLGYAKDDPIILRRLADYLDEDRVHTPRTPQDQHPIDREFEEKPEI